LQIQVLIKAEIKIYVAANTFFFFTFAKIVFIYNLSSVFAVFPSAAFAVVNCNLKNITANCQNALTFTNYFAGSSRGVPPIAATLAAATLASALGHVVVALKCEMRNGSGHR